MGKIEDSEVERRIERFKAAAKDAGVKLTHQRLEVFRELASSAEHPDAEVRQGTRLDALKFSLSANHQHGLRRTNEDKRHAVEIALCEFPGWADRAIAQVCGVSHPSVGAARRQLVNFTSCGKRLVRDGKRRRLAVKQGKIREPYALPGRPANGAERAAHNLTLEVAQMFGNLDTTVKTALRRFPGERHLILGL